MRAALIFDLYCGQCKESTEVSISRVWFKRALEKGKDVLVTGFCGHEWSLPLGARHILSAAIRHP